MSKAIKIESKYVFYTGIAFFAMHLISVFYSENKDIAWFDIEVKLSLILFPLIFIIKNPYISKYRNAVLLSFIGAVVLANIYMIYMALSQYGIHEKDLIYSNYLSIYIHPSYISMYNLFSIVALLNFVFKNKDAYRFVFIIPIAFLLVMIFMFAAKAGFIALALVVFYYAIYVFLNIKYKLIKYLLPILIMLSSIFAISQSTRMQLMLSSIVDIVNTGDSNTHSTGVRFEIWRVTSSIISNNIIFGVGAGDIKPELNKMYDKDPMFLGYAVDRHLNVHNQYLETWLGQGLIGLVLLLALFVLAIRISLRNKDHLLALFIIIIIVNFFPESMLNNMHGVVFFALFYYLFTLQDNIHKLKN